MFADRYTTTTSFAYQVLMVHMYAHTQAKNTLFASVHSHTTCLLGLATTYQKAFRLWGKAGKSSHGAAAGIVLWVLVYSCVVGCRFPESTCNRWSGPWVHDELFLCNSRWNVVLSLSVLLVCGERSCQHLGFLCVVQGLRLCVAYVLLVHPDY